jgi:hypothetical protein
MANVDLLTKVYTLTHIHLHYTPTIPPQIPSAATHIQPYTDNKGFSALTFFLQGEWGPGCTDVSGRAAPLFYPISSLWAESVATCPAPIVLLIIDQGRREVG